METFVKKELVLEGLDCPNCAAKIEKESCKIENVSNVSLNLMSRKLVIEFKDEQYEEGIINEVQKIVKRIEPDVTVKDAVDFVSEEDAENEVKPKLLRLGISGVIFLIGILFKFSFPVEAALFFVSYIVAGYDVLFNAAKNIFHGEVFDENFLMSIATIGAFSIAQFPEGVAVMLFYQLGELFEDLAVDSSRKSIEKLMDIRPDFANVKKGSEIIKVAPEEVQIGDFIIVKAGEKIPLDGIIFEGEATLDTSALTGESLPKDVRTGDEVYGGVINKSGLLTIKVTKTYGESTVSKILELVQNASSNKAPTENFITKFARVYTPVVVISALLLAFIPPLVISDANFHTWIYRALVFLVVSCPCALVISIPLGFFGGIGAASKNGILVKGSNYLEALNNVDTVVFDKTGTLTKGIFKVTQINPVEPYSKDELLEYASYAESFSNHPIAQSIVREYDKEINKEEINDFTELSGLGITVTVKGKKILAGNNKLMKDKGISINGEESVGTVVHLAADDKYMGYIVISDEVKEDSASAIKNLRKIGISKTVMLTGDSKSAGEAVAKQLGINNIYSELLPDGKVQTFESLINNKTEKKKIIFVGDGINDAPVLARADIGIAMGGIGSDAAIEASDIVIMTDEPSKIYTVIGIAKKTNKIVWENIIFSLGVKVIILALGAMGIATMWEAVFGDVGVALIAVLNSIRALRFN